MTVLSWPVFCHKSVFYQKWLKSVSKSVFIPSVSKGSVNPCFSSFLLKIRVYLPVGERVFWRVLSKTRILVKTRKIAKIRVFHGFLSVFQKWHFFPVYMGTGARIWKHSFDDPRVILDKTVNSRGDSWRVLRKLSVFRVFPCFLVVFRGVENGVSQPGYIWNCPPVYGDVFDTIFRK